jgi:hypothetical protein
LRLLDHVAQCRAPFLVQHTSGALWRLSAASDYAARVAACPLRYVLSDELVRVCVQLAYSEGDQLSACLDLVHFPAEELWIEWNEPPRRAELARLLPECAADGPAAIARGGVWIAAHPGGRTARWRTFWLSRALPPEPLLAATETLIDLDAAPVSARPEVLLEGGAVAVRDPGSDAIDSLLRRASFRLDPAWQRYYRRVARSAALRALTIERALAGVAFDVPLLLALMLLMTLQPGLTQLPVPLTRLNAKRARLGHSPLLEHIEVSCPLLVAARPRPGSAGLMLRSAPRRHHVRGHLVRRDDAVFWRRPHWRGHLRLGCVRSRTVELRVS